MMTSEVSLKVPMKVLTSGGITIASACGRTIEPGALPIGRGPSASAASIWPFGIACRPPRTTSAR